MGKFSAVGASGIGSTRVPWLVPVTLVTVLGVMYVNWAINWWRIATSGFDGWGTGDWLLSFDGGFVRRGLFGTLVLAVTPRTHQSSSPWLSSRSS